MTRITADILADISGNRCRNRLGPRGETRVEHLHTRANHLLDARRTGLYPHEGRQTRYRSGDSGLIWFTGAHADGVADHADDFRLIGLADANATADA